MDRGVPTETVVTLNHITLQILTLFMSLSLFGQGNEQFSAWIDTQQVDGKKIMVGWFRNNTTSPIQIYYEAKLKMSNEPEEIFKGNTLALPSSPTLLSKAIFTLDGIDFERLYLLVSNKEKEILSCDIVQTSPFLKKRPVVKTPNKSIPSTHPPIKRPVDVEIDGLVLDETRSKTAREFYELFYRNWSTIGISSKGRTIVIREKPGRVGLGANVIVEVDGKQITQLNLQPRAEVLENMAGRLVSAVEKYINNPNNNTVIEGGDLTGSGIY